MSDRTKDGYLFRNSNFSIRRTKHKTVDGGDIYWRDYMTVGGSLPSDAASFGESNFRILKNDTNTHKRAHMYGQWLKKTDCANPQDSTEFFQLCNTVYSDDRESTIRLKPNTNDPKEYAYYASCSETFKNAIKRIIKRFPAELYVSDTSLSHFYAGEEEIKKEGYDYALTGVNIDNLVYVENPFDISLFSGETYDEEYNAVYGKNERRLLDLRSFYKSYSDYFIVSDDEGADPFAHCVYDYVPNRNAEESKLRPNCFPYSYLGKVKVGCVNGIDLVLYIILRTKLGVSKIHLFAENTFSGMHVRPNNELYWLFRDGLTDIERMMLNENSKPKYTMELKTPVETDEGIVMETDRYTWPTSNGGWNLMIEEENVSFGYGKYISDIVNMSQMYDEYYTDNLWANMVHPSIKNMDSTYMGNGTDDDNDEEYAIGLTKFHKFMNVVSLFFDDIKRKIDNVGTVNTVTYDEKNNTPDYFLTDVCEVDGWDAVSVTNGLKDYVVTEDNMYDGMTKEFTTYDASAIFLRELKLNSKAILSRKGTRHGIEMLMALFGLKSKEFNMANGDTTDDWDYSISEYVCVAKAYESSYAMERLEGYNAYKLNYDTSDYSLQGLPVESIIGDDGKKIYIPWYDKEKVYDGGLYFQMKGGWEKSASRMLSDHRMIHSNSNLFTIYGEDVKYLRICDNVYELNNIYGEDLMENMVVRVSKPFTYDELFEVVGSSFFNDACSILKANSPDEYGNIEFDEHGDITKDSEEVLRENFDKIFSNYFCYTRREVVNGQYKFEWERGDEVPTYSWINVLVVELENPTNDYGHLVGYIESIVDNSEGNAPHTSYGTYDNGEEYLNYYRQLFKYSIDNDNFNSDAYACGGVTLNGNIGNCGFELSIVNDDKKCWFFGDDINYDAYKRENAKEEMGIVMKLCGEYDIAKEKLRETPDVDKITIGNERSYAVDVKSYNTDDPTTNTSESASNSVINIKNISLTFNDNEDKVHSLEEYYFYMTRTIFPYLRQMIPATAISEIVFNTIDTISVLHEVGLADAGGMIADTPDEKAKYGC